jgi:hypothetical protein
MLQRVSFSDPIGAPGQSFSNVLSRVHAADPCLYSSGLETVLAVYTDDDFKNQVAKVARRRGFKAKGVENARRRSSATERCRPL